jgi:DNA invertase Pin-like site-specific DNA recombinase
MKHMSPALKRVIKAQQAQEAARGRLLNALADAVDAGIEQTELARTVGISRVTLWRWLNESPDRTSKGNARTAA